MILGSPFYIALLIPGALLFQLLPRGHWRTITVLLCSYAYYRTFPLSYFPVLLGVTAVAFGCGLAIERVAGDPRRGWLIVGSIAACVLPLVIFKYLLPLVSAQTGGGADWQLTMAHLGAPVGLSFYTFAAVGYLIDVALGQLPAERNPVRLGLFCGFFPIVTAGPIPRTATVLPQLDFRRSFNADQAMVGVTEILFGCVMKLWIAESLSAATASVYGDLANSIPLEKLLATICFAFQIYADFAGYSLIAIGSARLLGVNIPDNFRQPYLAETIAEFWRRWHISLLSWLRDYVFTPLRFQWRSYPRLATLAAMFITFVLVGIWHGAGWGFVAFGVAHGILMVLSNLTLPFRDRLWTMTRVPSVLIVVARIPVTFLLVALTMVLIRATSFTEAIQVYKSLFSPEMASNLATLLDLQSKTPLPFRHMSLSLNSLDIFSVCILIIGDVVARWKTMTPFFKLPALATGPIYAVCVLIVLYQAVSAKDVRPFLYFQF